MIIIRNGKIPRYLRQFECDYCGCIFKADFTEYTTSTQLEVMHGGLGDYKCKCPFCDNMVYSKGDNYDNTTEQL